MGYQSTLAKIQVETLDSVFSRLVRDDLSRAPVTQVLQ